MLLPSHRHATLALLALCAPRVAGWTTISQSRYGAQLDAIKGLYPSTTQTSYNFNTADGSALPAQQTLGFLWKMPSDPTSHVGLGGGITWAWDDALCDTILSRFREDIFFFPIVTCDNIRAAMSRGFTSWSDNSNFLSFVDVTNECKKISPTGMVQPDCPLAEVYVTSISGTGSTEGVVAGNTASRRRRRLETAYPPADCNATSCDEAFTLELEEGLGVGDVSEALGGSTTSAAVAKPKATWSWDFRYTNGDQPLKSNVLETRGATVEFNADLCWYLDSTFCYAFHSIKELTSLGSEDIAWIFRGSLLAVWCLVGLIMLRQVCMILTAGRKKHHGHQCEAWSEALHKVSIFGGTLRVLLLLTPPIFYWKIFAPCWECYDFEAAATHEIGHVLGLSHPDNLAASKCTNADAGCGPTAGQNVYSPHVLASSPYSVANPGLYPELQYGRLNGTTCKAPWADIVERPGGVVLPSIMKALTQHNPRVCLSQDDLEALNVLYPDCEAAISEAVCNKTPYNLGWLRLAAWLLIPSIVILFLMLCIFTVSQIQANKRMERMLVRKLSAENKIEGHRAEAEKASHDKERHKQAHKAKHKELEDMKKDMSDRVEKEVRRRSIVYEAKLAELADFKRRSVCSGPGSPRTGSGASRSNRFGSGASSLASTNGPSAAEAIPEESSLELASQASEVGAPVGAGSAPNTLARGGYSMDELREVPYQRHEHHFKPGTLGYYAENIADDIGAVQNLGRRVLSRFTSKSGSGSRSSSLERDGSSGDIEGSAQVMPQDTGIARRSSKYEARMGRARKALGHVLTKVKSSFGGGPELGRATSSTSSAGIAIESTATREDAI